MMTEKKQKIVLAQIDKLLAARTARNEVWAKLSEMKLEMSRLETSLATSEKKLTGEQEKLNILLDDPT